jgi:hypothetical protein
MAATRAASLPAFLRLIVSGDVDSITRALDGNATLATTASEAGATRTASTSWFLQEIGHYVYAGDTALHLAAAAARPDVAALLLARGANPRARNRRGAEPLHYAADAPHRRPGDQTATIAALLKAGADPDALDKSGVAPLHRAVRNRSLAAVRALLDGGASLSLRNGSGATPLHLAAQTTGKSGSGTAWAREQQAAILALLLERGARPSWRDGRGRDVYQSAVTTWVKDLLDAGRNAAGRP